MYLAQAVYILALTIEGQTRLNKEAKEKKMFLSDKRNDTINENRFSVMKNQN